MKLEVGKGYRVKPNCKIEGVFSYVRNGKKLPVPSEYSLWCAALNNTRATFFVYRKRKKGGWILLKSRKMAVTVTLNLDQAGFLEEVDSKG